MLRKIEKTRREIERKRDRDESFRLCSAFNSFLFSLLSAVAENHSRKVAIIIKAITWRAERVLWSTARLGIRTRYCLMSLDAGANRSFESHPLTLCFYLFRYISVYIHYVWDHLSFAFQSRLYEAAAVAGSFWPRVKEKELVCGRAWKWFRGSGHRGWRM